MEYLNLLNLLRGVRKSRLEINSSVGRVIGKIQNSIGQLMANYAPSSLNHGVIKILPVPILQLIAVLWSRPLEVERNGHLLGRPNPHLPQSFLAAHQ